MKRLAWSEVRSARQPGLKQELRVLIELLRVLPRPGLSMPLTILPSNIMVGDDGSVLAGAARLEGCPPGEERYLAPEVRAGAEPLLPAAIFAVGALLFEAVTGHEYETRELVTQELAGARAMARAAGLGGLFWEIYLLEAAAKATEEKPGARWPSGSDFAEDLERVARDRIVSRAELGRLVAELAEDRRTSRPPAQSSAPPGAANRAAPPPLPKRVRRRTSSSKQTALKSTSNQSSAKSSSNGAASNGAASNGAASNGASPNQASSKASSKSSAKLSAKSSSKLQPAKAVAKSPRAAPISRTDGDALQLPLVTALRVPHNLRLPDVAPEPANAPSAPNPQKVASSSPSTPESTASSTSSTPPPARFNPVALGPRIDPDPRVLQKPGPSVASVVLPSLSAPPPNSGAGESRRRTLTGTGDLHWLGDLQPPADAVDPNRHATLLGLGSAAATARLEASFFPEIEPPTVPLSRSTPAPGRPTPAPAQSRHSTPPTGSPASSPQASSSPRGTLPSNPPSASNRVRYVQPATLESGWDSVAGSESDARISAADLAFLQKKSWMGRVLLAVVVLVALGIGTLGIVGHYSASDDEASADPATPKPPAERSDEPSSAKATAQAARPGDAPRVAAAEAEPAAETPTPDNDEPAPGAPVAEANPATGSEQPASSPPPATPARRAPPRAAPVRRPAPPGAPPAKGKGSDRDYGI